MWRQPRVEPWWPAAAKSERGLDLDCDVIGLDRAAFMRAMNDEASCPYRLQPFEGSGNPIPFIDAAEDCRAGGGVTRGGSDKGANNCFVRWIAKIGLDDPGSIVRAARVRRLLERRCGGRGRINSLVNNGGDPARRRLAAGKTHHMRGVIWGQAFEHGGSSHAGPRTAMVMILRAAPRRAACLAR